MLGYLGLTLLEDLHGRQDVPALNLFQNPAELPLFGVGGEGGERRRGDDPAPEVLLPDEIPGVAENDRPLDLVFQLPDVAWEGVVQ